MPKEIKKEILKHVPEKDISAVAFEAANIILYTKNKEYLFDLRMNYESMNIYTNTYLVQGKVEIEKTIKMIKKELNQQ